MSYTNTPEIKNDRSKSNINRSDDYQNLSQEIVRKNTNVNKRNESYGFANDFGGAGKSSRLQRLNSKYNEEKQKVFIPKSDTTNANIYFPGENVIHDDTREKKPAFFDSRRNVNRSLNMSQSIVKPAIEDSPKFKEIVITEAVQDHTRDGVEQQRYFSRLERSNRKQKAIFDEHYKRFVIPNVQLVNVKREHEQMRIKEMKRRMDQLEIEQYNRENLLKKKYNDFLKVQIAEKERVRDQEKSDKKRTHDYVEYKRMMYQDEVLKSKKDMINLQNSSAEIDRSLKSFNDRYDPIDVDLNYTLGGFDVPKSTIEKLKSKRQNTYLSPNPIVNPMVDFNQKLLYGIS